MSLEAMLAQYEKNSQTTNGPKKETDLNNYFTTFLPAGINQKSRRVRILPSAKENTSPFTEVMVHSIEVDGQWRKFTCPKHEKGEACPFCEARELFLAEGTDADKELAKKYAPRKMYVARVIDREDEAFGIKFWRFNHDFRKTGIMDKIQALLPIVGDFSNPETGRDLLVQIARDQNKRPVVQAIVHCDASPLSSNAEQAKAWLTDTRTWEDVYSVKGYDYLEIIVKGGTPVWDKEAKKYVDKASIVASGDSSDDELSMGAQPNSAQPAALVDANADFADEDTDDLPF